MHITDEMAALEIGNTPLIQFLPKDGKEYYGKVLVKLESKNAGGSVKARSALGMILAAEKNGLVRGGTIVEATSGNMGIALAYIGVKRGYKVLLTMPESMSTERRKMLSELGAVTVLTDAKRGMAGAIEEAGRIAASTQGAFEMRQFENVANSDAHYVTTGEEILRQTQCAADVFVAGVGTGGTLCGTARRLKEYDKAIEIVAVEPASSAVLSGGKASSHAVQGIGAGFVPSLYKKELVSKIITVSDDDAVNTFFMLNREYGISAGISSGANLFAALSLAANKKYAGKNIVTIFPDGADRYESLLNT